MTSYITIATHKQTQLLFCQDYSAFLIPHCIKPLLNSSPFFFTFLRLNLIFLRLLIKIKTFILEFYIFINDVINLYIII